MSEHEYEPTSEEIAEQEEERRCGMMDHEAWDVYQEAKRRGLDTVKAVERWYAGVPQEWEEGFSLQETYQKVVQKMEETKMEGKRFTVL